MSRFLPTGIVARLYGACLLVALTLAGVALTAHFALDDITQDAASTGSSRVPQLSRMAALELDVTRWRHWSQASGPPARPTWR
jgi:hypothetical protein